MTYQFELQQQPAQPALVIRARAAVQELPQVFGEAYDALMRYLAELGEQPTGMPFAAYHNLDMQNLDLEIGFPVSRPLPGKGTIQPGELPAGKWARVLHVGPYEQLRDAYEALTSWIADQGYRPSGVSYEAYCSEPGTPPEEIRTWIMFPLQEGSSNMPREELGRVAHYFSHLQVAVLELAKPIHVGDWLHIAGHTTDLVQQVVSLQINHRPVMEAGPDQDVALKVVDHVREHDVIYRIPVEEAREFEDKRLLERAW
jgi:effector-binding domain-containing protein